jgi:hypothetical protein
MRSKHNKYTQHELIDNFGQTDKGGRPPKEINLDQLKQLAAIQCTDEEICAVLGISPDTLARRKEDPEFAEIIDQGKLMGKVSLRRAHFKLAQSNPAVHIFACKNLLKMTDRLEDTGPIPQDQARRIKEALDAIDNAVTDDNQQES